MSKHLFMGEINKITNDRKTPLFVVKKYKY